MVARRVARSAARLALGLLFVLVAAAGAKASGGSATPAEPEVEPWEPDAVFAAGSRAPATPPSASQSIGLGLIHWYQRDVSTRSISRCPFLISCSNYATRAVERHGLLAGACYFIDRNLYRENPGIYSRYTLTETGDGTFKLDDTFFLTGGR